MFDPTPDTEWTGGSPASRPGQPGLLALVSTLERDASLLGKTFTYGYVVTAHETNTMVELKVDRPFPMLVRYELEDLREATLAMYSTGAPSRFFGWATRYMRQAVGDNIAADLERLRICLEG